MDFVYILIVAGLCNIVPVLVCKWKFLNYPVDFGLRLKGSRVFGANKTFRGLFWGILLSWYLVYILVDTFSWDVSYSLGLFIGIGILGGDLVGSFVKRRVGYKPGLSLVPLDQLDSVLGLSIVLLVYSYSLVFVLLLVIVWFVGHIVLKHLGYWLRLNKKKW